MSTKILVVEDEKHIAEGIRLNLTKQGYDVKLCHNGKKALTVWPEYRPDLIVLDLMLPELDGFKILENIRLYDERMPILILSARSAVEDKVRCFKHGVDDYMSKPFDLDEFLLRIERLLKRNSWSKEERKGEMNDIQIGEFKIDFDERVAIAGETQIELTIQELKLLRIFAQNEGKILSRKFLLENAFSYALDVNSRTVDNFIVRFRKYFEKDPKNPVHFKSKRAMGYIYNSAVEGP